MERKRERERERSREREGGKIARERYREIDRESERANDCEIDTLYIYIYIYLGVRTHYCARKQLEQRRSGISLRLLLLAGGLWPSPVELTQRFGALILGKVPGSVPL